MPNQKLKRQKLRKTLLETRRSTFNMPLRLSVLSMNYKKIYPIP